MILFCQVNYNLYLCFVGGCDIRNGFGEMFLAEGGLQPALLFIKVGACWSVLTDHARGSLLGPHLLNGYRAKVQKHFDIHNIEYHLYYDYLYTMKTVMILYMIMLGIIFIPIIMSSILFNYFPTARITDWFRRNIITDMDLEETPPPSDESET